MKIVSALVTGVLLFICSCQNVAKNDKPDISDNEKVKEINFYTPDSIKIIGDLYELDEQEATILLFHQGGSNARAEYASIVPKLIEKGFNILAIDQRMGGQVYGNYNRTVANIEDNSFDNDYSYCDAYNNLEGALDFLITAGFTGKKILWGSSYSASLAIQLAHQRQQDVGGVLAFSPASGGPMQECRPDQYFENLKVPLLILRPPNEMENESAKGQFELANKHNHRTYAAKYGIHGSSMLVEKRVGQDVEETWKVVMSFLNEIKNGK